MWHMSRRCYEAIRTCVCVCGWGEWQLESASAWRNAGAAAAADNCVSCSSCKCCVNEMK